MQSPRKIVPCLWFDTQGEEAARFYTGIFPDSRITHVSRYPAVGQEVHGKPAGSVMTVAFELAGQPFTALNGGPVFRFNEAVSLQILCGSQQEMDHYRQALLAGEGAIEQQGGWLKDRYGLSWQVVRHGEGAGGAKIVPCLWFDGRGEEAARFYTGIFPEARMTQVARYTEAGQEFHRQPPGSVMTVSFDLAGQPFLALNGGPMFKFNEAVSLQVMCSTQDEVDHFWGALSDGGDPQAQQCGWLKDRYGLSWQVVPGVLVSMIEEGEPAGAERAFAAMLEMKKLDIPALQRAFDGR